ncbi:MAG TPA: Kazal domain-containing protein [Xanthobacteraceae bacterium]|jgi:hypothetical protein|nr:Kazal domain-containing protein [Xanthobacteraceae bacterium]
MLHRFLMLAAVGAAALAWTVGDAQAAKRSRSCGGFVGPTCGQGYFCDPLPGHCRPNAPGHCVKIPQVCFDLFKPVCGCNGRTYSNDCWRQMDKEPKKAEGQCK